MVITMVDLNAPVWQTLSAAGNDAEKWLRSLLEGSMDFRENMEILGEDLSHQLSWYSATAYTLPHLAALCPRLSPAERMYLIAQIGAAIAAEAEWPLPSGTESYQEFHEGLEGLKPVTADLIQNHMDTLAAASEEDRSMFALGALAVLGNRKHAYVLYLLSGSCWEEGPAACVCGWEDEILPLAEEPDCIEPAKIAPWDGKSLDEEAVWLSGLLSRFGEGQILSILPLVYGTGVCPECGKRELYWTWHDRFMEE